LAVKRSLASNQNFLETISGVNAYAPLRNAVAGPQAGMPLQGADGSVLGMARSGNTLYIAGSFRSVGESSGGFVRVDALAGELIAGFPRVAGQVYAMIPDSQGGWYIGGEFTGVGDLPRNCLAQIRADGSVTDWNPNVSGSPGYIDPPVVLALAVLDGRIYVGGAFRTIGGKPRMNLGCVDLHSGEALDWVANTDGSVYALAVDGSTVFVGGFFFSIAGQPRGCLAAVDAESGAVRAWQADASVSVYALIVQQGQLFVGGEFDWIAGGARRMVAAIDIGTAQLLPFDAQASGIYLDRIPIPRVAALTVVSDTLYVGGSFSGIGGRPLASLAALNATTGDALDWTPPTLGPTYDGFPPPLVTCLAANTDRLYVGGTFDTAEGATHPHSLALNRESGAALDWNPKLGSVPRTLAVVGNAIIIGGEFEMVGEWRHRAGLAAIDLTTGALKPWNPNPNGGICTAVAVKGDRVFVSGDFTSIGGDPQPRQRMAALDTLNGEVLDWNPGADGVVAEFLIEGDTVYAGGYFTQIGGQPRNYVAALSAGSAQVFDWNPNPNWPVLALARREGSVYLGGLFSQVRGQSRRALAAVDAATGVLLPWDPGVPYGSIEALLVSGDLVYAGGAFEYIGPDARFCVAAIDATTGRATPWNPQPTAWGSPTRVRALALAGDRIYVGGTFGTIGGEPRICLAALDTTTAQATAWDPGLNGYVWSLLGDGDRVFAGGGFTRAGAIPVSGLVAFSPRPSPPAPVPAPTAFAFERVWPNPVGATATLRFSLPGAASASLEVFDLQGRRLLTVFRDVSFGAGSHEATIQTGAWPLGLYLFRLSGGGASATRKVLVSR
jgi:hypothetical protein